MNIWFLSASVASFLIFALHVFGGGKIAARPLLDTQELNPVAKYTNYYGWHIVSIVIASMGGLFLFASVRPDAYMLAWMGAIYAALFTLWNIGLNIWARKHLKAWYSLPQWMLFLPVTVLGGLGLIYG